MILTWFGFMVLLWHLIPQCSPTASLSTRFTTVNLFINYTAKGDHHALWLSQRHYKIIGPTDKT